MAIRIYLDTQDYYNLYKNRSEDHEEIYQFLLKGTRSQEIEIGFSYPLISEFLQNYDPKHKADRILRAKLIKELCGKKCFKFINRLRNEDAFSYKGDWIPQIGQTLDIDELKKNITEKILEKLPNADRKQRNKFKNKRAFKRLYKQNRETFNSSIDYEELNIPLSKKFIEENMLLKYIVGEIPKHAAEEEFLSFITDIELFITAWFEYDERGDFLFENLNQPIQKITDAIILLNECLLLLADGRKTIKGFEKEIRKNDLMLLFADDLKNLKRNSYKIDKIDKAWLLDLLENKKIRNEFPESFWDSIICYINDKVKRTDNIKKSDIGDIMHSIYIPYCDLWRGDKDFSNTLIKGDLPQKEKIVSRLSDLPKRVDAILNH